MRYSDDESEAVTRSVTGYFFEDDEEEPICFSVLPIQWCQIQTPNKTKSKIFLGGTADGGLQKIYKQVTAWKVDLTKDQPEVWVRYKEKNWIHLLKPRKSFEDTMRSIWITLHCLHFVKKNPETSGKSLWNHLSNVFSLLKVRPSENDLRAHLPFLKSAVKQDKTLSNSKFLLAFLENPLKRKAFTEDTGTGLDTKKTKFIVEDDYEKSDEKIGAAKGDDSDSVCALCDNGGDVLCCDGECFRSFHATVAAAGVDSTCKSLGLSRAQIKAPKYFCLNCQYKQHQCFACGKLGSSDKSSSAEVFPCVSATCGHFYHPTCIAELLHPGNEVEVRELQKRIAAGEPFTCPAHKCCVCKQAENKVYELQFAICRRCPRAYHRKCLPREVAFANSEDENIVPRAWDKLMPKRILIYCLKHEIEEGLAAPANQIIFPYVNSPAMPSSREEVKRKRMNSEDFRDSISARIQKQAEKETSTKENRFSDNNKKRFSVQGLDSTKRLSTSGASKKLLTDSVKSVPINVDKFSELESSRISPSEEKLSSLLKKSSMILQPNKQRKITSNTEKMKRSSSTNSLEDAEMKERVTKLVKDTASSITLKDITKNYRGRPAYSKAVDKAVVQEKVEDSIQAVRTALQKSEKGSNIKYSKDVLEPEILNRITEWKVVDKLHWYARKGDTIVNLSCGSDDFTCLMKQKLDDIGKECSFKTYEVCRSQNDVNAEKSDWMNVNRNELPTGTTLIVGINLPVGVESARVNKYVSKALEFRPKLLILFVPEETKRLDEELRYELVWEDRMQLSAKSLPSSVDMNDKQIKHWNLKPPLVYFWSRVDWTAEYKAVAVRRGHISKNKEDDDEPVSASKRSTQRVSSQVRKKKLRRLLIDDPSEDLEAANGSAKNFEEDLEAAKGSVKNLDSSSQSSSSVRDKEADPVKVNSLPSHGQLLLGSTADEQLVSSRTNMCNKSRSCIGSDANFLDYFSGPFHPCSYEQHSSCGWIDDE